jgi:hypothetical protein
MTLRITQELYERLQWAISIRPELTMTQVIDMAIKHHCKVGTTEMPRDDETKPGDVVICYDRERACADYIRKVTTWYLREQKAKIDARQVKPLDLEPCEHDRVEQVE